jgi:hypothetical protein
MSTKTATAETVSVIPYSTSREDGSITHLGITYSITHQAHQSGTPLETCVECGGSGQLYTRKCKACRGAGQVARNTPDLHAYQYSSTYSDESGNK